MADDATATIDPAVATDTPPATPEAAASAMGAMGGGPPAAVTQAAPLSADVLQGMQAAQAMGAMGGVPQLPPPTGPQVEFNQHMGSLHRILDRVGTALGGGENLSITKDAQGNVSVQHTPMTTGEKWARVAAAALGGAVAGAGAAQGPMGLPRAAGAGMQFGMQFAQQRNQGVLQQAEAEQKLATAKMNNILTNQRTTQLALENQAMGIQVGEEVRGVLESNLNNTLSGPDAQDYGIIRTPDDLARMREKFPNLLADHAAGKVTTSLMPDGQGGWQVHVVQADPNDANRMTRAGDLMNVLSVDPDTGRVKLTQTQAAKGQKYSDLLRYNNQIALQAAKTITAQNRAPGAGGRLTTIGAFQGEIANLQAERRAEAAKPNPDQARLSEFDARIADLQTAAKETASARPSAAGAAPLSQDELDAVTTDLADFTSGTKLSDFPIKQRVQITQEMSRKGLRLAHPQTTAELTRMSLANNAVNNIDEAIRILDAHPDMFGPLGKGKITFQNLLEGGNPNAQAFKAAVDAADFPTLGAHGFRSRYGLEQLNNLTSNFYTNAASTRAALLELRRSTAEFGKGGGRVPYPGDRPTTAPRAPATTAAPATPETGAPTKGNRSIGEAMKMPQFQGKSTDEVRREIEKWGYTAVP